MRIGVAAISALLAASPAVSDVITINDAYHFVDRVGTRSWGSDGEQYSLTFGVFEINLDSTQGTSGAYEQDGVTGDLSDVSSTLNKQFAARLSYDPNLTGSWTLSFQNGDDTAVFQTPEVADAVAPDYVIGVSQSGPATTPTFTFTPPPDADKIQVQILDLQQSRVSIAIPDLIFQENIDAGATSYTIPEGVLEDGGVYSVAFYADILRNDATSSLLGRSRVYYDFVAGALPDTGGVPVYLPQTDTTSGTPVFNFDNPVVKDALAFYDPLVAVGYDYELGDGDPLFRSVLLPDIGDGLYDLFLPDGGGSFDFIAEIAAGTEYFFDLGVDAFRVLGIETSAGLDPEDTTAFVTGLSFYDDGRFTGAMTPITADVPPIPLPAAGWLMLAGLGALTLLRREKV